MFEERTWEEFRESGLLWFINRTLHLFGWAIVCQIEHDGGVSRAYPARCRYRGMGNENESKGFADLTKHISENIELLVKTVEE